MSILAKSPDLTKIINKAIKRIGENHALARDNKGIEMKAMEIEEDRKDFRKGRTNEIANETMDSVIEESLKAVVDEMAEKMVLENTIDGMVKEVIQEQDDINNPGGHESFTSLGPVGFPIQLAKDLFKELPTGLQGKIKNILRGGNVDKVVIEMKEMCNDAGGTWNPCDEKRSPITGNPLESTCWCTNKEGNKITPWINKYQGIFNQKVQAILDKMEKEFYNAAEKLPTTGEDWDSLLGLEEGVVMNETTKDTIKKLVNKKLKDKLVEARGGFSTSKHPGLDTYEKVAKKSKTENDKAMKATDKKFKEYDSFDGNDNLEFPHQEMSKTNADGQFQYYRNSEDDQEFVDDFAHPGLIDYDINNLNLDRLTKYLEGSSETGNAQTDKDGNGLGNVVPSDLGKKMMKSAENRKEKIAQQKASMSNLRGYTPDVQKVKQVKEGTTKDIDKMKKLWSYNKNTQ